MSAASLLHYVSLDGAGGVELQFVEFLRTALARADARHAVVACGRGVHPLVADRLAASGVPVGYEKYAGPLKLPAWPRAVRAAHQRGLMRRHRPDVAVIWNRMRDSLRTLEAAGAARCLYWERGASWFPGETIAKQRFLATVPAVLCNSHAARRMLELRWGYRGAIRVVPNALRPSLRPAAARPRQLVSDWPLRLGVVARLEPIKGVALAVHALALLRDQGRAVTLSIAGDGPERRRLETLVARLDLTDFVRFEGLVADMGAFYRGIDLLVHPALREPFGQIAVEANAYGCPAVVAAVDGLVEVITHDVTGLCVAPSLPLADYPLLGGHDDDLPPVVYDPVRDRIAPLVLVDPERLAAAVATLADDPDAYARMSAAAIEAVATRFVFDDHVDAALAAVDEFRARGTLADPPASAGQIT